MVSKMQKLPTHLKKLNLFKLFYVLTLVTLFGSILFRVYCSNILAIKNTELRNFSLKKIDLEKEVSKLDYIDSGLSSLSSLEEKARTLGFVDQTDSLVSLNPDSPTSVAALSDR